MKLKFSLLALILLQITVFGQDVTQSIRGTITDKQSQYPLPGAKIIVVESNPTLGGITDIDGNFEIKSVPIGRVTLQITFTGYEAVTLSNLELKTAKELVINVGLEESLTLLNTVDVVYKENKSEVINKMATVSSRTISIEEAGKFAGSLNDPARMAQNYAGVSGVSDDRNDIIIRGNSPLGVLWRMEGVDIPSPNHFASLGTTGGPVSMLNINNLSNSDFYTSAWTADYGNALSGVFDLRLRNGNNANREFLGQVGFNGFEFGAEGPFSKKSRASYLVNYRYSTLGVMSALGIDLGVGTAIPQYQDLTFKMNFPTKKAGRFTLWGLGGISYIEFEASAADSTNLYAAANEQSKFGSNTAIVGGSHKYFFGKNTFYELILASSWTNTTGSIDTVAEGVDPFNTVGFDRTQIKNSLNIKLNHKFNAKNTIVGGIIVDNYITDMLDSAYVAGAYRVISDNNGFAFLLQSYVNYQHKFNEKWTFNGGVHSQHFLLSESNVIEPRLGFKFKPNYRNTLSIGSGMHSQIQPMTIYFVEEEVNNQTTTPNKSLDFSKAIHNVLGYDFQITEHLRLKTEVYYQYVYNVPVDTLGTPFSMINQGSNFVLPDGTGYTNEGTGRNFGAELTLERFLDKGFYFLFTTSVFDSKYKGSDGVERNTAYNGNYIFNILAGKEFQLKRNFTLSFDWKMTYAGGKRFTPIDLNASILNGTQINIVDQSFSAQHPNYFRTDFKTTIKHNGKKVNQEFSVDLQNFTNQKNIFQSGYNNSTQQIGNVYQRGFFPNVQYKINF
jgi:CarboxypepD_reg-like domain